MAENEAEPMVMYDSYATPLPAGSYRFVVQQTVSLEGDKDRHYYRDQPFEVMAPRYVIEGTEIQAYFPPAGGVADYQNVLPHLVLRPRNLPWERTVWPKSPREPWLALLVLSEQDISEGKAVVKTGTVGDLAPDAPAAALWSRTEAGATMLLPNFTRDEDPKTAVRLLDLDLKVFRKLCPRRDELPLLAHVRCVDTTNKIPLEMVADGEFAVLVANRFPPAGANTVHLISLEGWAHLIGAPSEQQYSASRVRLITLASWSFLCDSKGHDTFGGLMLRLQKNAAVVGVAPPALGGDAYVNGALKRGYVPVDYQPLNSTPTLAWYRGPLTPLAVKAPAGRKSFRRADAALIFDERTAIMDVSYASAWELGRMLALGSPTFSKGLRLFVESSENAAEFARQIATFLELHRSAFNIKADAPKPEEVAIADELVEWIARLVMLYPVPFQYLVPHPSLLPPESLRFFHLDDNWVNALVDGALSIAARTLAKQSPASQADLQSALSKIVYQHRLRLQGKNPDWNPSERYMDVPKSGFVLRSSILTGWPGVEVTAITNAEDSEILPRILRLDQIADGVLFCLARGSLKQVTFREPREGITFGVGTGGVVKTRNLNATVKIKELMRAGACDGVADIAAIVDQLTKLDKLPEGSVGSAEFGLQMIRMPEEQIIEWG
jgi:hypothetical protein